MKKQQKMQEIDSVFQKAKKQKPRRQIATGVMCEMKQK